MTVDGLVELAKGEGERVLDLLQDYVVGLRGSRAYKERVYRNVRSFFYITVLSFPGITSR